MSESSSTENGPTNFLPLRKICRFFGASIYRCTVPMFYPTGSMVMTSYSSDVTPKSQVMLQVKEAHRVRVWQGDLGSCILSDHSDWLTYDSGGAQKEIIQQAEKFTISAKFSPPVGTKKVQLLAEQAIKSTDVRSSILGKLGQARSAVETIVSVLEHVEEIHPIAKVALSTLTKAFKFLEDEEKYDESMRDLALGMADMLSFAEAVNQHAKIVQLKDTIAQMMLMVEDASRFILDSQSSSTIGRTAIGLISSERRDKIDTFIKQFQTLREAFDRGVTVQILDISSQALEASSGALQVSNQVLRAFAAAEERSLGEHEQLLLEKLPRARSAGYDPNGCCLEGTRTKILQDIIDWATRPRSSKFLWLYGTAGSGKSSIASSTAKELQSRDILGATFFCIRDKPELRDPALILPTIAARLAIVFPAFGKAVANQLSRDPQIGESAMQFQYEGLFAFPLKQIEESGSLSRPDPLIVVIDALDECGVPETRSTLLKYLLEISGLTNWLKVVATSRPEPDITRILGRSPVCTSFPIPLNDTTTYNDILFFTRTRMAEIAQANNLQPSDWPGAIKTKQLAELAGGLFIWAQTAYKFIASGYVPDERLDQLLAKASTPGIYSKLDALYTTALAGAFQESDSDNLEIFKLVVGTIVTVLAPLPVRGLFPLLGGRVSEIGIHAVVHNFRSVLYEDEKDSTIRVCHLSFVDFITDSLRCPQFFVDVRQRHTALAIASLQAMQDQLRFNACNLESSHLFNDQIPDLSKRVKSAIPIPLRYSCVHWMTHLRNSSHDAPLVEALEQFLIQETALYWIEALSLLGEIPAAIHGLPGVVGWLQDPENANSRFLTDVHRFILGFKEPITRSTPHLYISALPFAPTQSLISKRFLPSFPNTISLDNREIFWSPCLQTLEGHANQVVGVCWSPDGQRLVSGSYDNSICVWDSTTGEMVQRLRGHSETVSSVSFSPDSYLIASGSWDATIHIWDVETGVSIFPSSLRHTEAVYCVVFSPDGKYLASSSGDTTVCIWVIETGKLALDPFKGHSDDVWGIAYSPDGARIASCSADETVCVWDVKTGRTTLGLLTGHTDEVYAVDFSPDGWHILSSSLDSSIIIWHSTSGIISLGPLQVGCSVFCAKFSPDGHLILSTSVDSMIRIWNAETGAQLFNQRHSGSIETACFSPDGQHFVTGSSDQTVRIWELNSLRPSASSVSDSWHTELINSVGFSPDGKYIVSGSRDNTVRVWHVDSGTPACVPLRGHAESVAAVIFSPDSRNLLSASWDTTLRLWTVGTWKSAMEPFSGHTRPVLCAAFPPGGNFIVSGSKDCTLRLWNPETGKEICEPLRGHQDAVTSLAISSDGCLIGSGSNDETVKIWHSVTREQLFDLPQRSGALQSIAFAPDGQFIASQSDNAVVQSWDIQKQVCLWKSTISPSIDPGCCIFSRDGRHLFCSSRSQILILNANIGSTSHPPFKGHSATIRSLAISPNGKHLISGAEDQTICGWDIEFDDEDEGRQELLPESRKLFRSVGLDGWVRLQNGEPLLWIPTEYRDGLWKRSLFSIPPTAPNHPRTLDCSRFRHGNVWTQVRSI